MPERRFLPVIRCGKKVGCEYSTFLSFLEERKKSVLRGV